MDRKELPGILSQARLPQQGLKRRRHGTFEGHLPIGEHDERFGRIDELFVQEEAVALDSVGLDFNAIRRHDGGVQSRIFLALDPVVSLADQIFGERGNGIGRVDAHPSKRLKVTRLTHHRHARRQRIAPLGVEPGHQLRQFLPGKVVPARHGMLTIMFSIDKGIAQPGQFLRNRAAEFHRHHLILGSVNDIDRRGAEVGQERHQHVVEAAGHGGNAGKQGRIVHADHPGADPAVGHAGEKDPVRINVVAPLHGTNRRQHQLLRALS